MNRRHLLIATTIVSAIACGRADSQVSASSPADVKAVDANCAKGLEGTYEIQPYASEQSTWQWVKSFVAVADKVVVSRDLAGVYQLKMNDLDGSVVMDGKAKSIGELTAPTFNTKIYVSPTKPSGRSRTVTGSCETDGSMNLTEVSKTATRTYAYSFNGMNGTLSVIESGKRREIAKVVLEAPAILANK